MTFINVQKRLLITVNTLILEIDKGIGFLKNISNFFKKIIKNVFWNLYTLTFNSCVNHPQAKDLLASNEVCYLSLALKIHIS